MNPPIGAVNRFPGNGCVRIGLVSSPAASHRPAGRCEGRLAGAHVAASMNREGLAGMGREMEGANDDDWSC